MRQFLLPSALAATLFGLVAAGFAVEPRQAPQSSLGRPLPRFELPRLDDATLTANRDDMHGRVWLVNVWASWCDACRDEHAALLELSRNSKAPIYGIDYKDARNDGLEWLHDAGDPYTLVLSDSNGRVAGELGFRGVPATVIIDKSGIVRYEQPGPLTPEIVRGRILPLLKELNG